MWGQLFVYVGVAFVLGSFALFALATPLGAILLVLGVTALGISVVQWWRRTRKQADDATGRPGSQI